MDGRSEAKCLGCDKKFAVPTRLLKMAEKYGDDGDVVLFCSRSCNLSFVARIARQSQEQKMQDLIDSLEKKND